MQDFESVIPHDSILRAINIDRSSPGKMDIIRLMIDINGNIFWLEFTEVYEAYLHLNFGIVAEESIREVRKVDNDSILQQIVNKWSNIGVNISDLKCFELVTNSTNSSLKIFARSFYMEEV